MENNYKYIDSTICGQPKMVLNCSKATESDLDDSLGFLVIRYQTHLTFKKDL
jgi:hypothetical protein